VAIVLILKLIFNPIKVVVFIKLAKRIKLWFYCKHFITNLMFLGVNLIVREVYIKILDLHYVHLLLIHAKGTFIVLISTIIIALMTF